jgi:hypothetical protein
VECTRRRVKATALHSAVYRLLRRIMEDIMNNEVKLPKPIETYI